MNKRLVCVHIRCKSSLGVYFTTSAFYMFTDFNRRLNFTPSTFSQSLFLISVSITLADQMDIFYVCFKLVAKNPLKQGSVIFA